MLSLQGSPSLTSCWFSGNTSCRLGAGLFTSGGHPVLIDCAFVGNTCTTSASGGGMANTLGHATLIGCVFLGNRATDGGGFHNVDSGTATLVNCLFSGNTATSSGGGLQGIDQSVTTVTNCIFWANAAPAGSQIRIQSATAAVTYSCIQGGWAGAGNIDDDPLFVDPDGPDNDPDTWADNDYHLSVGSPCIEAGDPAFVPLPDETDMDSEPRIMGCRVDMGADESTAGELNSGDMDASGTVDLPDVPLFVSALLDEGTEVDKCVADINGDGAANGRDIQPFVDALFEP